MKLLRGYVLNIPGLRNVRDVEDKPDCRLVLLVHTVIDSGIHAGLTSRQPCVCGA